MSAVDPITTTALIYDRTAQDVEDRTDKGTYKIGDLQRIKIYEEWLCEQNDAPFRDFSTSGAPLTYDDIEAIVTNANIIRFFAQLSVPAAKKRRKWDYVRANEVERILYEAYIQIRPIPVVETVPLIMNLTHLNNESQTIEIMKYATANIYISAQDGYRLPDAITVERVESLILPSQYSYNSETGLIILPGQIVTDAITITATGIATQLFTLTFAATNATISAFSMGTARPLSDGDSISAGDTIIWSARADEGCQLVTTPSGYFVVDGDATITATAYPAVEFVSQNCMSDGKTYASPNLDYSCYIQSSVSGSCRIELKIDGQTVTSGFTFGRTGPGSKLYVLIIPKALITGKIEITAVAQIDLDMVIPNTYFQPPNVAPTTNISIDYGTRAVLSVYAPYFEPSAQHTAIHRGQLSEILVQGTDYTISFDNHVGSLTIFAEAATDDMMVYISQP